MVGDCMMSNDLLEFNDGEVFSPFLPSKKDLEEIKNEEELIPMVDSELEPLDYAFGDESLPTDITIEESSELEPLKPLNELTELDSIPEMEENSSNISMFPEQKARYSVDPTAIKSFDKVFDDDVPPSSLDDTIRKLEKQLAEATNQRKDLQDRLKLMQEKNVTVFKQINSTTNVLTAKSTEARMFVIKTLQEKIKAEQIELTELIEALKTEERKNELYTQKLLTNQEAMGRLDALLKSLEGQYMEISSKLIDDESYTLAA